jgi:histidine phosphotransfer protein HptB
MAEDHDGAACVYSRLGVDPDFGDIVEMFVAELPKRVGILLDHLTKENWEGVRQVAHQLKGAAGSYGFDAVSPVAGKVESAVRSGEPESQIREAVAELAHICTRVRGGGPPSRS